MSIEVSGFQEVAEKLKKVSKQVYLEVQQANMEAAKEIQRRARARIRHSISGDLYDSIQVKVFPDGSIRVFTAYPKSGRKIAKGTKKSRKGAPVYYAYVVEYGTKFQRAQPYFWPSVHEEEVVFEDRIQEALDRAVTGESLETNAEFFERIRSKWESLVR